MFGKRIKTLNADVSVRVRAMRRTNLITLGIQNIADGTSLTVALSDALADEIADALHDASVEVTHDSPRLREARK